MNVGFELQFQKDIFVTKENNNKEIIGIDSYAEYDFSPILLSLLAIVRANDTKLDHTLHSFSTCWQY